MNIQWSEDFRLGIEAIDGQHMLIVSYINELDDAIQEQGASRKESVVNALRDVADYLESHFSFEDALLEEAGVPLAQESKDRQASLIRDVQAQPRHFQAGDDNAAAFRDTLERWFLEHIKMEDGSVQRVTQLLTERRARQAGA